MPALNFKAQFAALVESGEKTQTIRQVWKRPIQVGDTLYLYTGMRTKQCRKLKEVTCKAVSRVWISKQSGIVINSEKLNGPDVSEFAKKDGFQSLGAFIFFFSKHYPMPFHGVLIEWDDITRREGND